MLTKTPTKRNNESKITTKTGIWKPMKISQKCSGNIHPSVQKQKMVLWFAWNSSSKDFVLKDAIEPINFPMKKKPSSKNSSTNVVLRIFSKGQRTVRTHNPLSSAPIKWKGSHLFLSFHTAINGLNKSIPYPTPAQQKPWQKRWSQIIWQSEKHLTHIHKGYPKTSQTRVRPNYYYINTKQSIWR